MIVFLNVLIAIVSDSYDLSMAKAGLRSRCELITETALIASLLPTRSCQRDEATIKARLAAPRRRSCRRRPEPPQLHHQAVAAIVDNRTQKLEAELTSNKTQGAGRDEGHAPSPRRQGRRAPRASTQAAHRLMNH